MTLRCISGSVPPRDKGYTHVFEGNLFNGPHANLVRWFLYLKIQAGTRKPLVVLFWYVWLYLQTRCRQTAAVIHILATVRPRDCTARPLISVHQIQRVDAGVCASLGTIHSPRFLSQIMRSRYPGSNDRRGSLNEIETNLAKYSPIALVWETT